MYTKSFQFSRELASYCQRIKRRYRITQALEIENMLQRFATQTTEKDYSEITLEDIHRFLEEERNREILLPHVRIAFYNFARHLFPSVNHLQLLKEEEVIAWKLTQEITTESAQSHPDLLKTGIF